LIISPDMEPTMHRTKWKRPKLRWTGAYVATIVTANWVHMNTQPFDVLGLSLPPSILLSGFVFVFRDFSQRDIGKGFFPALLLALALSYLVSPAVAGASAIAFLISELVDYGVYSATGRSFSRRVLLSSLVSVPVDTLLFFSLIGLLDPADIMMGIAVKMVGAVVFWAILRQRETSTSGDAGKDEGTRR
jgi:uncharacterized PurR-regulated membrane protein YhhQ (DUF165 family)